MAVCSYSNVRMWHTVSVLCVCVVRRTSVENHYHHHQSSYTHTLLSLTCRLDSTITPPMSLSTVDRLVLDYGTQPARTTTIDSAHFPTRTRTSFSFASHWSIPTPFPMSPINGTQKSTTTPLGYQRSLLVQSSIFATMQPSWKDSSLASRVQ